MLCNTSPGACEYSEFYLILVGRCFVNKIEEVYNFMTQSDIRICILCIPFIGTTPKMLHDHFTAVFDRITLRINLSLHNN